MLPLALHHGGVLTSPWWSFSTTMVKFFLHRGVFSRAPKRAIRWTALQVQCKYTKFFSNRQIGLFGPKCPFREIYAKMQLRPKPKKGAESNLSRSSIQAFAERWPEKPRMRKKNKWNRPKMTAMKSIVLSASHPTVC